MEKIHNHDSICKDIADNNTYVISREDTILGTGTIHQNTISRVYIHPDNQYKGIGTMLMDYLEKEIIEKYSYVDIDASLPATKFYINRGYEILTQSEHFVANRKVLSYSIMRKREFEINPALYNAPSILVKKEIELQGLDFDEYKKKVPERVYLLEKRKYLKICLKDMVAIAKEYNAKWIRIGKLSKAGHPHHPLYLPNNSMFEVFRINEYIENN